MSTEREELTDVLQQFALTHDRDDSATWGDYADVIIAAGYTKPLTVTTVEELDALRFKSAILDANGCPWVNDGDTEEPWCSLAERADPIWHNSDNIALPATVLHSPGVSK